MAGLQSTVRRPSHRPGRATQRGGFVMGLVAGLLVGLALALGVALYITKAPIPFVNKVPQRTAEQDTAEAERNRTWDPNAPLGGKAGRTAAAAAAAASAATATATGAVGDLPQPAPGSAVPAPAAAAMPPVTASASAVRQGRDAAAILSGAAPQPADPLSRTPAAEPFIYFVQAGAFTRSEDAEQQRARLAMIGQVAKVSEREQAGRTMYRVRLGPFATRDDADGLQGRLQEQGLEAQIVRVERQ